MCIQGVHLCVMYLCDFWFQSSPDHHLVHSVKAMESNPELWDYYFNDFIARTLHLETGGKFEGITQLILKAFFSQLYKEPTTLERVVQLHVYVSTYNLELAKMATVLRPLDRIQKVSQLVPNVLSPRLSSPTKELVETVEKTLHPLGTPQHLAAFIVGHLFDGLVGAAFGKHISMELVPSPDQMLMWYKVYR